MLNSRQTLAKYALTDLDLISPGLVDPTMHADDSVWKGSLGGAVGGSVIGAIAANTLFSGQDTEKMAIRGALLGGALGSTGVYTDPSKAINMATGAAIGGGTGLLAAYTVAQLFGQDNATRNTWLKYVGSAGAMAGAMAGKRGILDVVGGSTNVLRSNTPARFIT